MKLLYITSPRSGTEYFISSIVSVMPNFEAATNFTCYHTDDIDEMATALLSEDITHIILLLRKDVLRQAISLQKLSKTKKTHIDKDVVNYPPEHNLGTYLIREVFQHMRSILENDNACLDLLNTYRIPILSVFYEDFQCKCSLVREIERVLTFLGIPVPADVDPKSEFHKTSDYHSEMLYRELKYQLNL